MGDVSALEIAEYVGAELIGENISISGVSSLGNLKPNTLVFSKRDFQLQNESKNLVLCTQQSFSAEKLSTGASFIICKNPRLQFAKITQQFFVKKNPSTIHPTAIIADDAVIHATATIGAYCVIESGVTIGEGTVLKNHVVVSENVTIGNFCYIKSGAVIGEEGFGFDFEEDKTPIRMPHLGSVKISDYVEIGSNTTVARGTLENTIIGSYTKLDDHVHIAHNCELGVSCIVTACAELSGGVVLGGNNWIGPNASIIQKVKVEKDAFIGIGSVVTERVSKDIKVMGLSAMPLKTLAVLKRLVKNAS